MRKELRIDSEVNWRFSKIGPKKKKKKTFYSEKA